jgi:hypothetical protein
MPRKQMSGAQKRKLAKARAIVGQTLMPRAPTAADLASLTGVAREASKNYRDWKQGRLTHDAYLVSVRGLSALATALQAVEAERQREIDERLAAGIEALERQRQPSVPAIEHNPVSTSRDERPTPIVGELMPRESSDDEVSP